ncbi:MULTISPECIES: L-threonylcarbamoyladenylate synthase [Actibacterium]|uniref:Threonylcarbamoyl-AMP synthase n=1 Tax=Actibacterium naphthalenivorans TaxID=1614693 RepID=A0A840CCX2_9RHOB|nr:MULTISPECIES: L-threonylcarbamoyladenylate synthase [Actibacterium]MBB4022703.1 L-threonylcarbamoyladenylate synthase [Actibacterium naphthalenivorans]
MNRAIPTETLKADPQGLARAAELLARGGLVAFPTETVYGLGADARDDTAVARIFEAKGRPRFNPLIVHLPDIAAARRIALFPDAAERLAGAFWPGPLTLVLPLRPDAGLSPLVTAGNDTVALRLPAHAVARALLVRFGGPVAAPSANPSGKVSPTRAEHVAEGLAGRIEAVLDGGACDVGLESTIVGIGADGAATLLRPGGLPVEVIEDCLGHPLARRGEDAAISAPGQLGSHYAPEAGIRLEARAPRAGELWLGFGPGCEGAAMNLSPGGDLVEAAANLFHHLRAMDALAQTGQVIAVAPIPEHGLGRAINDRLRRAAAPRP